MAPQTEIQRYVRFEITGRVAYGWWRDGAIEELKGSIYGAATPTGRTFRSEQVRLLVPCEPSKVVAVGLNYASHQQFVTSAEGGFTTPGGKPLDMTKPVIFAKFPTSLIPDGAYIVFPEGATNVLSGIRYPKSVGVGTRDRKKGDARERGRGQELRVRRFHLQ
jgi:2-keto-4-pentenoate hydratase/2-oxohepta-3-ene-1,7-dioic acid hydratase in catechol pathway